MTGLFKAIFFMSLAHLSSTAMAADSTSNVIGCEPLTDAEMKDILPKQITFDRNKDSSSELDRQLRTLYAKTPNLMQSEYVQNMLAWSQNRLTPEQNQTLRLLGAQGKITDKPRTNFQIEPFILCNDSQHNWDNFMSHWGHEGLADYMANFSSQGAYDPNHPYCKQYKPGMPQGVFADIAIAEIIPQLRALKKAKCDAPLTPSVPLTPPAAPSGLRIDGPQSGASPANPPTPAQNNTPFKALEDAPLQQPKEEPPSDLTKTPDAPEAVLPKAVLETSLLVEGKACPLMKDGKPVLDEKGAPVQGIAKRKGEISR